MQNRNIFDTDKSAAVRSVEVSVRGRWINVPAFEINGQVIIATGRWIKTASLKDEEWLEEVLMDPVACAWQLKQGSTSPKADLLCFSQKVPDSMPRFKYPMEMSSVAVANISTYKEWWEALPQVTRKNVRRSCKRGVTVNVKSFDDELVEGIRAIQNETPIRQGRSYPHYGKSFEEVRRDHGAFLDRSVFICAYFGGEMIGVLKMVFRGNVASILQISSREAHYDKRPSNAMLAKAAELCDSRGIRYLTYGLYNYGNKGDSKLREFKVRNGFQEMLIPTYYLPLTAWGRLCVKMKLYRGILGLLPRWTINLSLRAREKWYDLCVSNCRCSSMPERSSSDRQTGCSNPPAGSSV